MKREGGEENQVLGKKGGTNFRIYNDFKRSQENNMKNFRPIYLKIYIANFLEDYNGFTKMVFKTSRKPDESYNQ